MKVVVVSPEDERADEPAVLDALFRAGLERYHVRKPHASAGELRRWIERVPTPWRSRLVLHQHHELVDEYRLGGRHWRDEDATPKGTRVGCELARNVASKLATHIPDDDEGQDSKGRIKGRAPNLTSRSCHDLDSLRASFGLYHSVFFGPVFPSISKPGYGPQDAQIGKALGAVLFTRTVVERRTSVFAIGGITMETAPRALAFGFDGVAVLGAIWEAADPLSAFERIQTLCRSGFICDPAAATLAAPIADKSAPTASALPS